MEFIEKHHFNQELDDYVKERRSYNRRPLFGLGKKRQPAHYHTQEIEPKKKGVLHSILSKKEPKPVREDVPEEHVKRVLANQPVTGGEESEESASAGEDGFFAKLRNAMFGSKKEEEEPFMIQPPRKEEPKQQDHIDPDVIEVLKISGRWLNRLDPETKKEFKESLDYSKYKFFVDKINSRKK